MANSGRASPPPSDPKAVVTLSAADQERLNADKIREAKKAFALQLKSDLVQFYDRISLPSLDGGRKRTIVIINTSRGDSGDFALGLNAVQVVNEIDPTANIIWVRKECPESKKFSHSSPLVTLHPEWQQISKSLTIDLVIIGPSHHYNPEYVFRTYGIEPVPLLNFVEAGIERLKPDEFLPYHYIWLPYDKLKRYDEIPAREKATRELVESVITNRTLHTNPNLQEGLFTTKLVRSDFDSKEAFVSMEDSLKTTILHGLTFEEFTSTNSLNFSYLHELQHKLFFFSLVLQDEKSKNVTIFLKQNSPEDFKMMSDALLTDKNRALLQRCGYENIRIQSTDEKEEPTSIRIPSSTGTRSVNVVLYLPIPSSKDFLTIIAHSDRTIAKGDSSWNQTLCIGKNRLALYLCQTYKYYYFSQQLELANSISPKLGRVFELVNNNQKTELNAEQWTELLTLTADPDLPRLYQEYARLFLSFDVAKNFSGYVKRALLHGQFPTVDFHKLEVDAFMSSPAFQRSVDIALLDQPTKRTEEKVVPDTKEALGALQKTLSHNLTPLAGELRIQEVMTTGGAASTADVKAIDTATTAPAVPADSVSVSGFTVFSHAPSKKATHDPPKKTS